MTSTAARARRSQSVGARRLPASEPMTAPTTTAPIQRGRVLGSEARRETLPARPAIELPRMKGAARPEAARVSAHPAKSSTGLRKMPPPVPVRPESSPMAAPMPTAGSVGTWGCPRPVSAAAARLAVTAIPAAANSRTKPTSFL